MRSTPTVYALGALAAFGQAETIYHSAGAFTIEQEIPEKPVHKHGLHDMAHFHMRYGNGTVPQGLMDFIEEAGPGSGSAPNFPHGDDVFYTTPMFFGSNQQKLNLDLDTGSSDLWVFSNQQPRSQRRGHGVYKPAKSTTSSKGKGLKWDIMYGDGSSAGGNVYFDDVTFGGVTVQNQAVETAQHVSRSFVTETGTDGLLGFAFSKINTVKPTKQKTWIDNAASSVLDAPVFGVRLNYKSPGKFDLGFINKNHYTGKIHYASVNSRQGFWQFQTTGYAVAGGKLKSSGIKSIADTGTTLVYLPNGPLNAYYSKVKGAQYNALAGAYIAPCSSKYPTLTLRIGGSKRVIPGKFIKSSPLGGTFGGYCLGGLQPNTGIPFSILGDVFLASQYAVFDLGKERIGFANK